MLLNKFLYFLSVFYFCLFVDETFAKKKHVYAPPKSSIVIDYFNNSKILFSEQPDAIRHPASLTKMMTVYLLFEGLRSRKINLNTKFKVSKLATNQAPSKLGLKVGEKIKVIDVIKALLVKSANDVAVVAAEGLCGNTAKFADLMNKKAKQLGMRNTHFENPSGLPNKLQVTTARDICTLGIALFKYFPQYWHFFKSKTFNYGNKEHHTHCKILKWYKGSDGAKTGYICASGFNLFVTAQKYDKKGDSKRLFVVVIGGESSKVRDLYAAKLMDRFFGNYTIFVQSNGIKENQNKKVKEKDKKANKHLLKQIDKAEPSAMEKVLEEEEEINIKKVLDYSADEMSNIDDLYIDDEEEITNEDDSIVRILDEEIVN